MINVLYNKKNAYGIMDGVFKKVNQKKNLKRNPAPDARPDITSSEHHNICFLVAKQEKCQNFSVEK